MSSYSKNGLPKGAKEVCGNWVNNPDGYNPNSVYVAKYEVDRKNRIFNIHLSGCEKYKCRGCFSPSLRRFDVGKRYACVLDELLKMAVKESDNIDYIVVQGGEPCDQHNNYMDMFMEELKTLNRPMILWTCEEYSLECYLEGVAYQQWFDYLVTNRKEYKKSKEQVKPADVYIPEYLYGEVYQVPDSWKLKDRDRLLKVNPFKLISYDSDDNIPFDEMYENQLSNIPLYFGLNGEVYAVDRQRERHNLIIELLNRRDKNWVLTNYVKFGERNQFFEIGQKLICSW